MINLTDYTEDIIDAIKFRSEKMTESINIAINENLDESIVEALKERQDKLNELTDRIENAVEEEDVQFALLNNDEMEQIE